MAGYYLDSRPKIWYCSGFYNEDQQTPFTGTVITSTALYYVHNGLLHREDGPAFITYNCVKYCKHGLCHRDGDEPAKITPDSVIYYKNGNIHRDFGPAVIDKYFISYMQYDKLHREDGPAVIYANGEVEYWLYGERQFKHYN